MRFSIRNVFFSFLVFASLFAIALQSPTPAPVAAQQTTPVVGVPKIDPVYGMDVEQWWDTHALNPNQPNGIPIGGILSPEPVVNVKTQFNGDIQAAIDSLPATGGTLFFEPGVYQHNIKMVGRSNIHFIANPGNPNDPSTQAIIQGGLYTSSSVLTDSNIASCDIAVSYTRFNAAVYNKTNAEHAAAIDCAVNRKGGFYFKNLVFDGNNTAHMAFMMRGTRDIVFDSVVFQNFFDPGNHHAGNVNANAIVENIWCRGCTFKGKQRYAWYLDGAHGGGVVNSHFERAFGSGVIMFLTNDDLTADWNKDGIFSNEESRISNYMVVANNTFVGGYNVVHGATAHSLVKNNTVTGVSGHMAHFFIRHPSNTAVKYNFVGNKVIGNTTQNMSFFTRVGGPKSTCPPSTIYCATIGQYHVSNNTMSNVPPSFGGVVIEDNSAVSSPVQGPNTEYANCVNGKWWGSQVSCTEPYPGTQPSPTPSPSPSVSPSPSPTPTVEPSPSPTPTVAPSPTPSAAPNLILNASFEQDADNNNYPDSWWSRIQVGRDATVARTGNASMKIWGDARWPYNYVFINPSYPVLTAGKTYTMRAWVKTQNVTATGFQVRYTIGGITYGSPWVKTANDWTEVKRVFTVINGGTSGRFDLNWHLLPNETVWVDDVELCEGNDVVCSN